MHKQFEICLTAFFVFFLGSVSAATDATGYARDGNGNTLRSANGLCWRTGYWAPGDAVTGCDGELAPPIGKPTAPEFLPTPQQAGSVPALVMPAAKRCDFQLTVDSDSTFGFGSDHLSAAAKKHVASQLQEKIRDCGTIESVSISAFTDRLGGAVPNQLLSERRAASLLPIIAGVGIRSPIDSKGFGSTQSVTQCAQHLKKTRLIHCLAPDRRATITVRGIAK